MRSFEIIDKPDYKLDKAKLTIAVDRISLKLNTKMDETLKDKINHFVCDISEKVDHPFTVRGEINFNHINGLAVTLYTKNRKTRERKAIYTFTELSDKKYF